MKMKKMLFKKHSIIIKIKKNNKVILVLIVNILNISNQKLKNQN